jgi:Concanavalin A-like lectin/glucanases superfamily
MSEIAPQTSEADLKSKIPPVYLRRMAGISPYASQPVVNPVLLLHFDGNFTDSSLTGATMTASGGTAISATNPKFGQGDASFPSAAMTSILSTPVTANGPLDIFGPTTGKDFTIEGFFMAASYASPIVLLDYGNTGAATHNGIVIEIAAGGTSISVTPSIVGWTAFSNGGAAALPVNVWNHFALVRKGAVATFYLNGTALPNGATNWTSSANSPGQITFGASATITPVASSPFFVDEFSVWPSALFTANFTPQIAETPNPFVGKPIPPVRGIWEMAGVTYTVIGDSLYSFVGTGTTTFPTNTATLTLIGSGIAGSGFVRMSDNTKCLLILLPNTNVAYTFTLANGLQQLLDETFTFFGAKDVWFIDDFMVFLATNGLEFYNDDGQIVSGTGPITFTTGGVFPREFGTDPFVGMCVDHRTIHLFGTRTSEGYVDVGNAQESPFAAAPDAFMQIGCHPSCGYTVALQDQAVMWVANDLTVRRLNGQTPIRISNSGIESFLEQNKLLLAGSYALCPTVGGHPLWILTIPLASKSLVYDCLTTEWFELSSLVNNLGYWRPFCYFNSQGLQLVGDSQTSSIGFLDANTFTEFGLPQAAIFYTQSVYDNHNRIRHQRLELVMTPGGSTSITATARVVLLSSDNSGAYFVARPARSLGTEGNRRARAIWFKLGMSRDRAYGFQVSDPTPTFTVQTTIDVSGGKW